MNHYPHHIGDFNNATRHLTRVERALYRDLMDLYYDTEKPLPGDDFEWLAKRILAVTDDEKAALRCILGEFFILQDGAYYNARCDREIKRYQSLIESASRAGKASAERRSNAKETRVQRSLKSGSTNQNQNQNQNQVNPVAPSASAPGATAAGKKLGNGADPTPVVEKLPLNDGTEYAVHQSSVSEYERLYPAVDVPQTLREMRGWCLANKAQRKTKTGIERFINRWLAKEQNAHG